MVHLRRILLVVTVAFASWNTQGLAPAGAASAPANDARAAAQVVGSLPFSSSTSTAGATLAAGESAPCAPIGATVWFRYRPTSYHELVISTRGSDFDTVVSVSYGPSGQEPSPWSARCGDDAHLQRAAVGVAVFPGNDYWIQVGGHEGATGQLRLSMTTGATARFALQRPDGSAVAPSGICPTIETQLDDGLGGFSYGPVWNPTGPPTHYELRGLPGGAVRAVLRPCSSGPTPPAFAPVRTPWLHVTEGVVTDFPPVVVAPPASVRVTVRDVDGLPLGDRQVDVRPASPDAIDRFGSNVRTGSDGRAVVAGLAGGSYSVSIYSPGYSLPGSPPFTITKTVSVSEAGSADLSFDLHRDGFIQGNVTDEAAAIASGACVQAFASGASSSPRSALTSETGFYRIAIPAGPAEVRFGGPDCGSGSNLTFGPSAPLPVTVPSGGTAVADGVAAPASAITGTVRTPDGAPVTSGCVQAFRPDATWPTTTRFLNSPTGFYRLGGLSNGDYHVTFAGGCTVDSPLAPTWYGGADRAAAVAVAVAPPAERSGIDLVPRVITGGVRLRIVDEEVGKTLRVGARIDDGSFLGIYLSPGANGVATAKVRSGTHVLAVQPFSRNPYGTADYAPQTRSIEVGDAFVDVTVALRSVDDDGDGRGRRSDNCPFVANASQADIDDDDLGDACDAVDDRVFDADADGIEDEDDNCPQHANVDQADLDADDLGDACDEDDDADGVADAADNCPRLANGDQANLGGDAMGDACDPDDDGDGVADGFDNCARLANTNQANIDGDGVGDACDPDDDGDAVPDDRDNCPVVPNATQADRDRDGVGDACDRVGRAPVVRGRPPR